MGTRGHIVCSNLAYAHPGGELLFSDVAFRIAPGQHVGLVGVNGVGKTTLLTILAGELAPTRATCPRGRVAVMATGRRRDDDPARSGRCCGCAPSELRVVEPRMIEAENRLAAGDDAAGMALGTAVDEWSSVGGYEREGVGRDLPTGRGRAARRR